MAGLLRDAFLDVAKLSKPCGRKTVEWETCRSLSLDRRPHGVSHADQQSREIMRSP